MEMARWGGIRWLQACGGASIGYLGECEREREIERMGACARERMGGREAARGMIWIIRLHVDEYGALDLMNE